jgi:hypothetical protein
MHVDATNLSLRRFSTTQDYEAQDKGPISIAIVVTLASVALLTYLLRVYTRGKVLRDLGVDDWLMTISAVCMFKLDQIAANLMNCS